MYFLHLITKFHLIDRKIHKFSVEFTNIFTFLISIYYYYITSIEMIINTKTMNFDLVRKLKECKYLSILLFVGSRMLNSMIILIIINVFIKNKSIPLKCAFFKIQLEISFICSDDFKCCVVYHALQGK